MRKWLKAVLPSWVCQLLLSAKQRYFDGYACKSYSQEGEDLILGRLLEGKDTGFYVDVGAHHPKRFSNTYRLYKLGWSGINIDAMPDSMRPFQRFRHRDINLEIGVAKEQGELTFYIFNEPALNTFDEQVAHSRESDIYKIVRRVSIKTLPLRDILAKWLPDGVAIDLLTIDAEGYDSEVLQSNDWSRFSPMHILVECCNVSGIEELLRHPVYQFLNDKGYGVVAKTANTVFFKQLDGKTNHGR